MSKFTKTALIFVATATLGLAESYTGKLIDANCSGATNSQNRSQATPNPENNQQSNTLSNCAPTAQTKVFAIQTPDGKVYKLNTAGNKKAEDLMKTNPTASQVTVSGSVESGQMLKVSGIEAQ